MLWSYGITTTPSRAVTLLPRTVGSLARAGFDQPRLFMDGIAACDGFGHPVTYRTPKIGYLSNWVLALTELYYREPGAERFVLFQDDLITYPNLRAYLEQIRYEAKTYWNLYTVPESEKVSSGRIGWYPSVDQLGKGALALVFDQDTVLTLLESKHLLTRVLNAHNRQHSIDGGVNQCLRPQGWTELVHNPTLVQHTGLDSTIGHGRYPEPRRFAGSSSMQRSYCVNGNITPVQIHLSADS